MDREFVKMIITTKDNRDNRLIMSGDFIDNELFEELSRTQEKLANKAFYICEAAENTKYLYDVEMKCIDCGNRYIETASKTAIFNTFKKLKNSKSRCGKTLNVRCEKCLKKLQDKEKEKKRKDSECCIARSIYSTSAYIADKLSTEMSFNFNASVQDKINEIMYLGYAKEIDIQKAILAMPYTDFLKTPYWEGIRCYKLRRAKYSCELCSAKAKLNVHHRTYKNHGLEHRRSIADSDLIVLCEKCHKKFHDIVGD